MRLCGYEQFSYLANCGQISFDAVPLESVSEDVLRDADAVVFVRGDDSFEVSLAKKLKRAGKYLVYVLDDDLLNIPGYISSADYYHRNYVMRNISELMSLCDCLLTPSQRLAQKYGDKFQQVILIEEPALTYAESVQRNAPVKVGFAGSIDRALDFEQILAEPLRRVKAQLGDQVSIEFFGAKPDVADELGCKWYPYTESYEEYQQTMKKLEWDIGRAPMPDTEFHACKHYNKFIEYGSYGIISVCSDHVPYTRVVKNWENGVLCQNTTQAWTDALVQLITASQTREQIRTQLCREIKEDFQVPEVSMRLWSQLDACITKLERYTIGSLGGIRMKRVFAKLIQAACTYRWKLPVIVVKKAAKKLLAK